MRLLIAIDESSFADPMIDFVINHKWSDVSQFEILHVIEPLLSGTYSSVLPAIKLDQIAQEQKGIAQELLHNFAIKLRAAFPATKIGEEVIFGRPGEIILDRARQWKADLIIVGSHGRRGIDRLIMGSVSSAIVANACCSVLVVRLPATCSGEGKVESLEERKLSAGS